MLFFTLTFMEQPPHFLEHFTIFVPTYKNKLNFFTKIPPKYPQEINFNLSKLYIT